MQHLIQEKTQAFELLTSHIMNDLTEFVDPVELQGSLQSTPFSGLLEHMKKMESELNQLRTQYSGLIRFH